MPAPLLWDFWPEEPAASLELLDAVGGTYIDEHRRGPGGR
jgi:hypothetical protein